MFTDHNDEFFIVVSIGSPFLVCYGARDKLQELYPSQNKYKISVKLGSFLGKRKTVFMYIFLVL